MQTLPPLFVAISLLIPFAAGADMQSVPVPDASVEQAPRDGFVGASMHIDARPADPSQHQVAASAIKKSGNAEEPLAAMPDPDCN